MSIQITIDSKIQCLDKIPYHHIPQEDQIKNEPMLFAALQDYAWLHGGFFTKAFLRALPERFTRDPTTIIDSRVHMLMKGWYPCIPGYHHDDVPREREDGQPNYHNPSYNAEHVMMLTGDCSVTEFALGRCGFPDVPLGQVYYQTWHPIVLDRIRDGLLLCVQCPIGKLVSFDWRTWHQGTKATKNGWRFFIRASRNTNRPVFNEIRKQVQVYLEFPMEGW